MYSNKLFLYESNTIYACPGMKWSMEKHLIVHLTKHYMYSITASKYDMSGTTPKQWEQERKRIDSMAANI